jgi:very-short-patch-repair endonuclease/lambda repressor-like predicted transcriptional regulator
MTTQMISVDLDKAIALYEAGEPIYEISRKMGISHSTLSRRFAAIGYQIRDIGESTALHWMRYRTPPLEPILERYKQGESLVTLARESGIGASRLNRLLREAGIPIRHSRENILSRYAGMSEAERKAQVSAANQAKRGKRANHWSLERRAQTMERTLQLAGRADLTLAVYLAARGAGVTLQKAIGPYNLDIAVDELLVAIEVNGYHHTPVAQRMARSRSTPADRRSYVLDRGWRLIEVLASNQAPYVSPACADRIVALLEEARGHEPSWGEYCVIGSDGEFAPGLEDES